MGQKAEQEKVRVCPAEAEGTAIPAAVNSEARDMAVVQDEAGEEVV